MSKTRFFAIFLCAVGAFSAKDLVHLAVEVAVEEKGEVRAEWFATGSITVPVEGGAPGDTVTTDFVWDGSEGTDDIWNSSCTDCALQLRQEYPIIVDEVEVARMRLYTRATINRARREGFVSR